MSKLLKVTATFIGTCMLATTAFATTGTVTTNNLRIRQGPSTEGNIIEIAGEGQDIEVVGEEGDWYEVVYNGQNGYASKQFIEVEGEIGQAEESNPTQEEGQENSSEEPKQEEQQKQSTPIKPIPSKSNLKGKALDIKVATSMYLLPSFTSRVNLDLAEGSNVVVLYDMQNWLKVEFSGYIGWISSAYLDMSSVQETTEENKEENQEQPEETKPEENQEQPQEQETQPSSDYEEKQGYINSTIVNVRSDASTSADVVAGLEEFAEVTIVGEKDDFYEIKSGNINGYVAKRLVTIGDSGSRSLNSRAVVNQEQEQEVEVESVSAVPTNNASYNVSLGEQIVEEARQYLGYDYVYAGKTPETGFDCSGFTRYVYGQFGIGLGGSSGSQANVGKEVDEDDMKPGDLLIYLGSDNSGVGHVGIYEGEGKFIHAANPSRGVVEDSINNSYYAPRLVSVRRLAE